MTWEISMKFSKRCDIIKSNKKLGLHPLSWRYIFLKSTGGGGGGGGGLSSFRIKKPLSKISLVGPLSF